MKNLELVRLFAAACLLTVAGCATSPDDAEAAAAAQATQAAPDPARAESFAADDFAIAFARIECHYFVNKGWFRHEDQLLDDAVKLKDIPGVIVHGRYDMCTPVVNAFDLAARWPEAETIIVADGGHALAEPGIAHELIAAAERFKSRPA